MAGLPVAITLLTVVAGCADRENDLDTYYDDRPAAGERSDDAAAAPRSDGTLQGETTQQGGDADTAPAQPAGQGLLLTPEDVREEGVAAIAPSSAGADPAAPTCLATLAEQPGAVEIDERAWRYPTGSTLHHLVTRYENRSAADVPADQVACSGEEIPVSGAPQGVDAQAWCQAATCTVVIAAEDVLSTVEVRAADQGSATEAIHRLAPVAVGKHA
ncbi:hypothetical protein GCM10009676_07580 [Prauserella halophila]|uniref:DUF5642 domain-containing protein n=1 Tax=Prauserella halophila TaxID=185641 RepID=A0ABN1VYL0_9PSEU|nr:hypothetical protein [Prauserella halophila]MCP2237190.1 hypothetical protein [Prauserella halophila]